MIYDGHIHMLPRPGVSVQENREELRHALEQAGVGGGVLLSLDPMSDGAAFTAAERIEKVRALAAAMPELYVFYWIHPTDEDAAEQVDTALKLGVDGFKVICSDFYPSDPRAMAVYRKIAAAKKPILFHSGICWDGKDSAKYNRPGEFECLIDVPNLRFCLAHVAWPWCDELIAVYGKFNNAFCYRPDLSCEMFIDITPGTPPLWREEVFKKLFLGGYDVMHNVIFGSDCGTNGYNVAWVREWLARDAGIFEKFGLDREEGFLSHIYGENLLRFIGVREETFDKKIPMVAV